MEDVKYSKDISLKKEEMKDFYKFIKLLPNEYFNNDVNLENLLEDFCNISCVLEELNPSDIEDDKVKECFKNYILDDNRCEFNIKKKSQLLDIKNIKGNYYFDKIEATNSIKKIKNYITKNFFNMDYKEFSSRTSEVSHVEEKTFALSQNEFDEYYFVADICFRDTKKALLSYWDKLMYFCYEGASTYFERTSKSLRKIYQKDLTKNLTCLSDGFKIESLKGKEFDFLVSDKMQDSDSLSVNHINSSYMSVDYNTDYMFIFNNVKPKELIKRDEGWALSEDIDKTITSLFDRRVIQKKKENKKFKPNGILCFDDINDEAVEIAKEMEIPLIIVERKYYASVMKEKLDNLFNKHRAEDYYYKKIQMFLSIKDNPDLLDKYFSVDILEKEAMEFISNMDSSKTYNLNMLRAMFRANFKILEYSKEKSNINFNERNIGKILKNNRK